MPSNSFRTLMLIKELYSLTNAQIGCSMKETGLTPQQTMVIKLIAHHKEITMSKLCEELSLAKASVSGIVQRLEEAGYVTKYKKDTDKRNTYVIFSEKGAVFAKNFKDAMNNSFSNLFSDFTKAEMQEIEKTLNLLLKKIKRDDYR